MVPGPFGHIHLGFQPGNPLLQGCFGLLLHPDVQGRVYPQATMVDHFGAVGLFQRFHHRVQKIAVHPQRTAMGPQVNGRGAGFIGLHTADHAGGHHAPEHHLLPGTGTRRVTKRVVPGGRFGQAGQKGRFGQGQFSGGFAEKSARRLADTIGTDTKGNLVDVSLQYFLLGKLGFDLKATSSSRNLRT
jgi:hypothetical protein